MREVKCGDKIGPLPIPTLENDEFLGWYTELDGGTRISDSTMIMTNVMYHAHWKNRGAIVAQLCRLTLTPNNSKYGTVSGGGEYKIGATATLKAAAKTGNAFAGWFTDMACTKPQNPKGYDNRSPTVKVVVPENDTTIYAKFVTAAEAKKSLKFSSATVKLAKTPAKATAGSAFSLKLGISSATLVTVTATGLPKGLKIDKATGAITGTVTVPGDFTATVTVKDAAGNKITQKVKVTVEAAAYAKGDFYGTAKPGKKGDPTAYLQFTVGKTGKVSGKVTYKGKAYSFKSTLASCTASKATFTPKVKIGKATFKPGAVTIRETENVGGWLVEAANKKGTFTGQKKANLVKKGKALAKLVGKSFTFTKKTKNSGLKKSGDKLKVMLADGDKVTASGMVNGKKLAALSAPLIVSEVSALDGMTTYTLYADILDAKTKYYKTVVFTVKVPVVLNPVPKVSAAFAK
ncbi:MAG: InlB B-repeat-containing protein [Kiritimatiellae bacterium]|nr:InlB B-repeat-containing protein [Kiritimatiellia bacterium]